MDGGLRLTARLEEADELFSKVEKPREFAKDAELFGNLTEFARDMAKGARPGVAGCTPQRLLARLKSLYVPGWTPQTTAGSVSEAFKWAELGRKAGNLFSTVPEFTCIRSIIRERVRRYGPMSLQVKERKLPQRRQKQQPTSQMVNPQTVSKYWCCTRTLVNRSPVAGVVVETNGAVLSDSAFVPQVTATSDAKQQETDRNMNKMNKILKQVKRVSLARLINNPRSFAQTVENLFTLSFLVRDGRAELLQGEFGIE
eukprot:4844791-Pyramimonas_sp.AAC.1